MCCKELLQTTQVNFFIDNCTVFFSPDPVMLTVPQSSVCFVTLPDILRIASDLVQHPLYPEERIRQPVIHFVQTYALQVYINGFF